MKWGDTENRKMGLEIKATSNSVMGGPILYMYMVMI
jgi:hypothetical protein